MEQAREYRESRLESLVAALLVSVGAFGLVVANNSALWERLTSGGDRLAKVGRVIDEQGGVRLRLGGSLLWHDLGGSNASESVNGGDTVFTGEDGWARVQLDRGGSVELSPGSLVVVHADSIRVDGGSVKVALLPGATPMKIDARGKTYEVTGAENSAGTVSFSLDAEDSRAAPKITGAQGVGIRDVGAQANVKVDAFPYHGLYPVEGERVYQAIPAQVRFGWQGGSTGTQVRVEVDGPTPKAATARAESQLATITLGAASYRWRLVDAGGLASPWRTFSVVDFGPPHPLGPSEGYVAVTDQSGSARIHLTWEALDGELAAETEIAQAGAAKPERAQAGFDGVVVKRSDGQYTWRVRARRGAGAEAEFSPWSAALHFEVAPPGAVHDPAGHAQVFAPKAPESALARAIDRAAVKTEVVRPSVVERALAKRAKAIAKPAIEILPTLENAAAQSSTKYGPGGDLYEISVKLAWKPVRGVSRYRVTVLTQNGGHFTDAVVEEPSMALVLKSLQETEYKYRVSATLASGKNIASAFVPIRISLAAPTPVKPRGGETLAAGQDLLLTWSRTSLTRAYRLQIAEDAAFSAPVVDRELNENFFTLPAAKAGAYFWRVLGISTAGKSGWSRPSSFKLR